MIEILQSCSIILVLLPDLYSLEVIHITFGWLSLNANCWLDFSSLLWEVHALWYVLVCYDLFIPTTGMHPGATFEGAQLVCLATPFSGLCFMMGCDGSTCRYFTVCVFSLHFGQQHLVILKYMCSVHCLQVQWNLTNPNSLGPELVQISEIFGLMKQYI